MDTKEIKIKLQEELAEVEAELAELGVEDPETGEFNTVMSAAEGTADENELADRIEDFEVHTAETDALEDRRDRIIRAVEKVEEHSYGTCDMCECPISTERLEANPSAITCVEHA